MNFPVTLSIWNFRLLSLIRMDNVRDGSEKHARVQRCTLLYFSVIVLV